MSLRSDLPERRPPAKSPTRPMLLLAAAAFGLPAVVGILLIRLRPESAPGPLVATLLVLAGLALAAVRGLGRRAAAVLVPAATIAVLLLWPEMALRAVGFTFSTEQVIQFGYPRPEHFTELEADPDLFWRLPRGARGLNSLGLLGPEIEIPKPAGVRRVAFYGDSCTRRARTIRVAQLLDQRRTDGPPHEVVNLAVDGYSSYQGLVLARRWAEPLAADVAVIYFGWNDHWQAYGAVDKEKRAPREPPPGVAWLLESSRLVQWIARRTAPRPLGVPRVSLEDYAANLEEIGRALEAAGTTAVFVTAPSAHRRVGVPNYLVEMGFAPSREEALERHLRYNERAREVATERGWLLLDLEALVDELEDPGALFFTDGIHFNRDGREWLARRFTEFLGGVLDRP